MCIIRINSITKCSLYVIVRCLRKYIFIGYLNSMCFLKKIHTQFILLHPKHYLISINGRRLFILLLSKFKLQGISKIRVQLQLATILLIIIWT